MPRHAAPTSCARHSTVCLMSMRFSCRRCRRILSSRNVRLAKVMSSKALLSVNCNAKKTGEGRGLSLIGPLGSPKAPRSIFLIATVSPVCSSWLQLDHDGGSFTFTQIAFNTSSTDSHNHALHTRARSNAHRHPRTRVHVHKHTLRQTLASIRPRRKG